MTQSDFIGLVNGKPWANRACSFDEMDCWGLVVLYYRHVLGLELHTSPATNLAQISSPATKKNSNTGGVCRCRFPAARCSITAISRRTSA
jgi:hypothetical protein